MPEWLYDPKAGTLLGRTASSWFKITVFYILYYSFIGLLSVGSLKFYTNQQVQPGTLMTTPSVNNLRLDQPGIVAHPLVETIDDKDTLIFKDGQNAQYLDTMQTFLAKYKSEDAVACLKGTTPAQGNTCKVANYNQYNDEGRFLKEAAEDKRPIVFLTINKVIGWTPVNQKTKHFAGFNCYEVDAFMGNKVENSDFDVTKVQGAENNMNPNTFPFPGKSGEGMEAPHYNQPFVAIQSKAKDGVKGFDDGKAHIFRCEIELDNIQGLDDNESNSYNDNIRKLAIGFTEWAVQYEN